MSIKEKILGIPFFYKSFMRIISGDSCSQYVKKYVRPERRNRILDIGCGPADILEFLPDVDYTGFDPNPKYIHAAQKRFGGKGRFLCQSLSDTGIFADFDIVLANGVLHHLNDSEVHQLFDIAKRALKPSGRLVTIDCCYEEKQSPVARFLIAHDRGRYPRTKEGYVSMASHFFGKINAEVRHDLLRVPYTNLIMECMVNS